MNFKDAIALFVEDGRVRELSPRTLEHYRMFLDRFAEWSECRGVPDVRDVTLEHVLAFRRSLDGRQGPGGRKTTVTYRNRHVRCARLLFRLLFKRGLILSNLAARIPEYRDPKRLPRGIMDKDQVTKLLQAAHLTTPTGFRDRTIFEVLYSTGLRGGELCKLTLYEVNLQERMLRVVEGKGRKDRVVPVGKVACSYLAEYIRAVRPLLLREEQTPVVFVTAQGTPFKTNNLRQQFILHRDRAGLPDLYTVHSLRHTCATEMLKGGASIRHVQELLGHASISTTQIYTHVVQTDLKKAHARTAPSERRQAVAVPVFDTAAPSWNDRRNARFWPVVHGQAAAKKARKHEGKGSKPGGEN
jgi:integrase/recombinase XerD